MSSKWSDRIKSTIKLTEHEKAALDKQVEKTGNYLLGSTYIIDMKDFSFATATDKHLISEIIYLLNIYQDNYPERLQNVFLINVSSYFVLVFSILKSFLSVGLIAKISIYSSPADWKPELLKYIDAEILPAFLGGNKTDPDGDPLCKSFVHHGGKIPAELCIHKSKNSIAKSKDAKKLILPRATFSEIEVEVKEPGSLIEWEFEIKCRDIGFGLFLKERDDEGKEKINALVPLLRLDTDEFSETGVYKCEKPGTYVMLFDNSYSWVRSKEIYYKAAVVCPKDCDKKLTN
nr:retinal-binding protein [Parasteatoda tepidariorum]